MDEPKTGEFAENEVKIENDEAAAEPVEVEYPLAENTTVNKREVMAEVFLFNSRTEILIHTLLIFGAAIFLAFKPLVSLISQGRYSQKITVLEIIVGAVVAAAGLFGMASALLEIKKRVNSREEGSDPVRSLFYKDRIEVDNGENVKTLSLAKLAKTAEREHTLIFCFTQNRTTEIFFVDKEGFAFPEELDVIRNTAVYRLKPAEKK